MKRFVTLLLIALLFATPTFAATKTWDGGGADAAWSTAANWTDDVAPADFDDLVLTGDVNTNNLSTGTVANRNYSVTYDAAAGTFYVGTAGQTIRLKPEGFVNNSTNVQLFTEAMNLNPASLADCTINCAAGPISFFGPASAQLNFNTQPNGIVKEGAFYLDLGSGNCSYRGNLTINNGTVLCRGNAVVGAHGYGMVIVKNGATIDLNPTTGSRSFNRKPLLAGGTGVGGNGAVICSSTGSTTWNSNLCLTADLLVNNVGALTFKGTITGAFGITKIGAGTMTFTPASPVFPTNEYTGITKVNGGTLNIQRDGALGVPPAAFAADHLQFDGGKLIIPSYEMLDANRGIWLGPKGGNFAPSTVNSIWTNNCVISGPGSLTLSSRSTWLGGANTFTGGLYSVAGNGPVVTSDANFGAVPGSPQINVTVSNAWGAITAYDTFTLHQNRKVNLATHASGAGNQIWVKTGKTLTIAGELTGGSLYISPGGGAKPGTNSADNTELKGTVVLAPGNTYTNQTTLNNGTLEISADSCLGIPWPEPLAAAVRLGGDSPGDYPYNAILRASDTFALDSNRGVLLLNPYNAIEVAASKTLTVLGDVTSSPVGGLNKIGAGTLVLSGYNVISGAVNVVEGVLGGSGSEVSAATVKGGAGLAAGASIGVMSFSNVTMEAGSRYLCECTSVTNDVLHVIDTMFLPAAANSVTVTLSGAGAPDPLYLFNLDNPLGSGDAFSIYVDKGSVPGVPAVQQVGNSIVITGMLPEPALAGVALLALALLRRR